MNEGSFFFKTDKMNAGMKLITMRHVMRPCVVVEMSCRLALSPLLKHVK